MQVRAQVSLSGQASCSGSCLQRLGPKTATLAALRPALHYARSQRLSQRVCAEGEKGEGGLGGVLDKVKGALGLEDDEIDENILEYCSLDPAGIRRKGKMTLGEKEQEFLAALRAYYYDEKALLSNEEFDNLKEDLIWAGSKVAVLSTVEQKFMEATLAYQAGKPIVTDEEYDNLRRELRNKNSKVVQQGPRCSIRSKNIYADANPDYLKMTLLNLPAAILTLILLFSVDDITGFEITYLLELPQPWGIFVVWGLVLPLVYIVSSSLTNLVLRDFLILKGPCPECGTEATTYFGDIFTVKGPRVDNTVTCSNCKASINVNAERRSMIISGMPGGKDDSGSKKGSSNGSKGDSKAKRQASPA
ncbi:hypothetical protein CVIRNUC_001639 [Coccomyxa viridis]|uniref:Uncharacterized protein n=1 Tax=Coccomyxa viridis TaxID=1274662 RepID=A0AAV1HTH8_9CHLO|nr:hypothetical protein CVIRNUC_001639 [Coccomyxa viridis]